MAKRLNTVERTLKRGNNRIKELTRMKKCAILKETKSRIAKDIKNMKIMDKNYRAGVKSEWKKMGKPVLGLKKIRGW